MSVPAASKQFALVASPIPIPIKHAARMGSPADSPGSVVNRPCPPNIARGFVHPVHAAPVAASMHTAYPAVFESFTFP